MKCNVNHHESDLYIEKTPLSEEIISDFEHKNNVTIFKSNIDDKAWYDVPFSFSPYWERRVK